MSRLGLDSDRAPTYEGSKARRARRAMLDGLDVNMVLLTPITQDYELALGPEPCERTGFAIDDDFPITAGFRRRDLDHMHAVANSDFVTLRRRHIGRVGDGG